MKKKLLIHFCCAPCGMEVLPYFKKDYEILGFWFNPNIQPRDEHDKRRASFFRYAKDDRFIYLDYADAQFSEWYDEVLKAQLNGNDRCAACYAVRLRMAYKKMRYEGIDYFTTTLLASPYQKHKLIKKTAEEIGGEFFLYHDFRPLYYKGKDTAHHREYYLQKYCGCLFSRNERLRAREAKHTTLSHV